VKGEKVNSIFPLGHLTFYFNQFHQLFLIAFEAYTGGQYWIDGSNIGAADYHASDAWRFSDNTVMPMDNNFWSQNMPDNAGSHHCVRIKNLKFNDYSCSVNYRYICEQWCRWSTKMKVPFLGLPIFHFYYSADPRLLNWLLNTNEWLVLNKYSCKYFLKNITWLILQTQILAGKFIILSIEKPTDIFF
jgi:hypothetical protein